MKGLLNWFLNLELDDWIFNVSYIQFKIYKIV